MGSDQTDCGDCNYDHTSNRFISQRNPFPSLLFSSSLIVKRNLHALHVCISRFLHFHGIYILELKSYKILSIFWTKHNHSNSSVSESITFVFTHAWIDHFHFPKRPKEMGKFWKFELCCRNTIYCQIEIEKLNFLEERGTENLLQLVGLCELCGRWKVPSSDFFFQFISAVVMKKNNGKIFILKKSSEVVSGFCFR